MKLELNKGRLVFTPSLLPTVVCVLFVMLFLRLGFWQLERAEYKATIQEAYLQGQQSAPLGIDEFGRIDQDYQYFPVRLEGQFVEGKHFLLDNQVRDGKTGFNIITPFVEASSGQILLVDRGWIPMRDGREKLPDIQPVLQGKLLLEGVIYFPSEKAFTLQDDNFQSVNWPLLIQKIDLLSIGQVLGVELAPFLIRPGQEVRLETGEAPLRQWVMIVMPPEKSIAYAFQWFGMALLLSLMYLVFSCHRLEESDG